jgi:SnoaL-like domain
VRSKLAAALRIAARYRPASRSAFPARAAPRHLPDDAVGASKEEPMKRAIATLALCLLSLSGSAAFAGTAEELRVLYERFLSAQNSRDIARVRPLLLDAPRFLWVSDGKSFWGREAMLARMASFQEAEVWEVDPDLEKAIAVEIGREAGYLHLPLLLTIGAKTNPDRLRFLVSMVGVRTPEGWRIAALFTTTERPE